MKNWEAYTKPDGMVAVQTENGEVANIKNDGITGYSFVMDYLERMQVNYKNHLRAADLILQRQLGDKYKHIRNIHNVYNSNLAIVSMNCAFGNMDQMPDCDSQGGMHFEFVSCPFRATCPYNGYSPANKGKELSCCNPVYETGLTRKQREVADLLVNTSFQVKEIAQALGVSEQRMRNITCEIYSSLGVNTRQELMLLLQGKRLY